MKIPYKNTSGDSGISNFEVTDTSIIIEFLHAKERYIYDSSSPGEPHLTKMKNLAMQGQGLATYISQNVKKNFAAKIPL